MLSSELILDATLLPAMAFALAGGLLSFLSPCVLPVVAPYLAYMGGVSVTEMAENRRARLRVLGTAAMFVLGLSTVFAVLGLSAAGLGRALVRWQGLYVPVAGVAVMILGAHFIGVFRIGFLDREARFEAGDRGGTALGAYILGLAFAFGWTPCLGPILGGILSLAGAEGRAAQGALLLLVYAMGLGVPFLLAAAFFPRMKGLMDWMKRHMERIEKISGLLLWTLGLLLATGQFTVFSNWLLSTFPILQEIG